MSPKGYVPGKMYELNIEDIALPASQTRSYFDPTAMEELQASIQRYGVLQPVIVTSGNDSKFVLVSGERRYQACVAVSLPTIPAIITDGNPEEITIVENLLRQDLTAIEEAEAINALKTSHSYQLSDLCSILGKAGPSISDILSLNKLPEKVKNECRNDPKASRHILAEIAREHNEAKMQSLYDKYKEKGLTRGEIRESRPRVKKAEDGPVDFSFVTNCTKRLDSLRLEKVDVSQVEGFIQELEKLRSAAYSKLKSLRAEAVQPATPPA